MEVKGLLGTFYKASEWITRLVYLNVLWIAFSLAGLVFLGFMPATAAMFAVTRKWLTDGSDFQVLPIYWLAYKREFGRANLLGLILLVIGWMIYVDLGYFGSQPFLSFQILKYLGFGLFLIYLATIVYVFPVLSIYEIPLRRVLVIAIFLGASKPVRTLLVIPTCILLGWLTLLFPVPLFLVIGSVLALGLMWNASGAIKKMDKRVQKSRR